MFHHETTMNRTAENYMIYVFLMCHIIGSCFEATDIHEMPKAQSGFLAVRLVSISKYFDR